MSDPPAEPVKKSFVDFKVFYDTHPDLDNSEYYAEFPRVHASTVRSWKTKAKKPPMAPPPKTPAAAADPYDAEMVKLLCTQTGTPLSEFDGIDTKSAIIILKNKLTAKQLQKPAARPSNSSILPNPPPIGQNKTKFGLDDFIVFDEAKNEIRMEIPMDNLMDPDKNKDLGKISR